MKSNPIISVVTVSFNAKPIIEDTITSIIKQSYSNIEYIIIDGNSNDGTLDIIKKYTANISYWISEPDKGIYDAMNKAINIASGDWIIFINAGDKLYDNTVIDEIFNSQLEYADVYYGNHIIKYNNKSILKRGNNPFYNKKKGYRSMGFSHQAVFVKMELAKKNPFDLEYKCCADYNMIFNIYKQGGIFLYTNKTISVIEGEKGFSENNRRTQMFEEAKICDSQNDWLFKILFQFRALKRFIHRIINI